MLYVLILFSCAFSRVGLLYHCKKRVILAVTQGFFLTPLVAINTRLEQSSFLTFFLTIIYSI